MAKYCGECGTRLDMDTGLCPKCDKEKLYGRRKNAPERGIIQKYLPLVSLFIVVLLLIALMFFLFSAEKLRLLLP